MPSIARQNKTTREHKKEDNLVWVLSCGCPPSLSSPLGAWWCWFVVQWDPPLLSQIAPRVVQKAPLLICSGKYLICVRGRSIASMCFNYTGERRLALGTIWCKVNLYFVRSRFILYRMLCIWHLHVHGDQITMHISMYILCCSGKIVYILLRCQSLCIFGRVRWMHLSGVSYSLFDPMVWESLLEGAHWIWTGVEREKLVFDFGNIWVDVFDTYMSMVIGSPCPCKHLMLLLCGDPRNSSRRYRGGGTAKRGDYHDSMSHTAVNLTVLSCAKVRNYYRRDRSGTAKRGNSHDSRTAYPVWEL